MRKKPLQFPLEEKIGPPELLVGRINEFTNFNKWLNNIPGRLSKSRVILARRKSGKTSFVQRIFNQLWSQNGKVVPFYFDFTDQNIWLYDLALKYYCTFMSHYISFLERDPTLISNHLSLENIHEYVVNHNYDHIARDTKFLLNSTRDTSYAGAVWHTATEAPHNYASGTERRFLVILDEFQNIASHVYMDEDLQIGPNKSLPGSFHSLSESKVAPMLVTGSYPGILMEIMAEHLEAGRLSIFRMNPYLTSEEGLAAVEQYAKVYQVATTAETEAQLNKLCGADPDAVTYETEDRNSEMSKTWAEYLRRTFRKINGMNTKKLMLFLNKHNHCYWRPRELKDELKLDLSEDEIFKRLEILVASDVIDQGKADIDFIGLKDGTLKRVLRSRFEKEIDGVQPNFRGEFEELLAQERKTANHWRGVACDYKGRLAERTLAFEFRMQQMVGQPLLLADYFEGMDHAGPLKIVRVKERVLHQHLNGENCEIDLLVQCDGDQVVMIEVRDREQRTGVAAVTKLQANAQDYGTQHEVEVLAAYLSLSGFTDEAKGYCGEWGIGMAERVGKGAN